MRLIAKQSVALTWALGLVLGTSALAVDVRAGNPSLAKHQTSSSNPHYTLGRRYPTFGRRQPALRRRQEESADDITSQGTERLRKCKCFQAPQPQATKTVSLSQLSAIGLHFVSTPGSRSQLIAVQARILESCTRIRRRSIGTKWTSKTTSS